MPNIYLDHASTTYMDPQVRKAMEPFFCEIYGNPSSLHKKGQESRKYLDQARETVAKYLNCSPTELIFTGSGTESANLAIKGVAKVYKDKGKHIITSVVEHKAVLNTCKALEKEGFEVTYVKVDQYGLVDPKDIKKALRKDTILVSIMYANNEIGTIEPIQEISKVIRKYQEKGCSFEQVGAKRPQRKRLPFFHVDACQAAGALTLDTKKLGIDLMTINGSKIYGPKGIGILYKRENTRLEPLIYGGGQENNLRSGTENLPGIVGLAKALELAQEGREEESKRLITLRTKLIDEIFAKIPKVILNGHPKNRLPNNANISFLDIEGESIMLYLDKNGVYVSTGSACTSTSLEPSHVLTATGLVHGAAHGSIRFTLGRSTTEQDIDYVLEILPTIIEKLRKISPLNLDPKKVRK